MRLRRFVTYRVGSKSRNPGAAGAQCDPVIVTKEELQFLDEDGFWKEIPLVVDHESREAAECAVRGSKRKY